MLPCQIVQNRKESAVLDPFLSPAAANGPRSEPAENRELSFVHITILGNSLSKWPPRLKTNWHHCFGG